jgi:hypothetical protein
MMLRYASLYAKRGRHVLNRNTVVVPIKQQFEDLFRSLFKSALFWAKALKFQFKVCELRLKVRSLRLRHLKLVRENVNLVRKQTELLLLKVNYIFFDSGISERLADAARDLLPVSWGNIRSGV